MRLPGVILSMMKLSVSNLLLLTVFILPMMGLPVVMVLELESQFRVHRFIY